MVASFHQKYNSTELAASFEDSSVSGGRTQPLFTVTANSGAVTSTADKKFGTASLRTDASSNQCLSIPDNSAFAFGGNASDFTLECWFKWTGADADWSGLMGTLQNDDNRLIFGSIPGGGSTSGTITCHYATGSIGSQITLTTSTSVSTSDGWHHLAYVREGNTWTLYLDGSREATTTDSRNNHDISARWTIGKSDNGADNVFNGYIDEVRISHGGSTPARYSGASYTVPTSAFTPDDSTILLLHMNGANSGTSFPDDGPHTITANGDATNQRPQHHDVTANGDAHLIGPKQGTSVISFDGTNDRLTVADSTDWDFGSGDFTFEWWAFPRVISGNQRLFATSDGSPNDVAGFLVTVDGSGNLAFAGGDGAGSWVFQLETTNTPVVANKWQHMAFVRDGTDIEYFVDGVSVKTGTYSGSGVDTGTDGLYFGEWPYTGDDFKGYMDGIRVSNSARYTAAFDPPTSAFSNDSNTKFLLQSGTDGSQTFTDGSSGSHSITAVGDVRWFAPKVGAGAMAFDGDDYFFSA